MNKRFFQILAVIVAVSMMSLTTFAQPGGGGGGRNGGPGGGFGGPGGGFGGGGVQIFRNPEVVKLLEITSEQKSDLDKIAEEMRGQRPQRGNSGDQPAPPSREEMEKRMNEMEKRANEVLTKINQVLKPDQQEKFKVLSFQLADGLDSPRLSEQLLDVVTLTEEQKGSIRKIVDARNVENRAAFEKVSNWRDLSEEDREKLRNEGSERSRKYTDQIKAVLTPEQKAKAEKLTAEAPAVKEKLGVQRGNRQGGGQGQGGGGYRPGAGSWQPGQGTGTSDAAEPAPSRQFPRSE